MDLLLFVKDIKINGGKGGAGGINGRGGDGGPGGSGGSSYTWSTTHTHTYYENGEYRTRHSTRWHTNPGGSDGSPGHPGRDGCG